jgi:hypothetical protein
VEPPIGDKIATFPTANEEEPIITPVEEAERFAEAESPLKSNKRKAPPRTAGPPHAAGPAQARQVAQRFLAKYASLEGLSFREAIGYWANAYVPGDPAMRLLEARLRD